MPENKKTDKAQSVSPQEYKKNPLSKMTEEQAISIAHDTALGIRKTTENSADLKLMATEKNKNKTNHIFQYRLQSGNLNQQQIVSFFNESMFHTLFREDKLAKAAIRNMRGHQMRASIKTVYENEIKKTLGQHELAEFYIKDSLFQGATSWKSVAEMLEELLLSAAKNAKATILTSSHLNNSDESITVFVVIAESHLILHYFPKDHYLAVDIYTCGEMDTELALKRIIEELNLTPYDRINFKRGILGKNHPHLEGDENGSFFPGIALRENIITEGPLQVDLKKSHVFRFFDKVSNSTSIEDRQSPIARHFVGEFYCSDTAITNDGVELLKIFQEAFEDHDFKFSYYKNFNPQGASAVLIGKGIHITAHPWPELAENYTPVDVFVSDECNIDVDYVMQRLANLLKSQRYTLNEFPRGVRNKQGDFIPVLGEVTPKVVQEEKGYMLGVKK